ncbi:pre-peptidase C-terminal domain-containing protein [Halocatena salina]|uniref:Pre-peptidase C-terminal domain-containing protein n=1 Tax=Halocatena salina TaxID=2934340 RepID=A0A8U0A6M3_9EURY|nr:pre-peptidase C-terminal domain-containing protein [Halocatena salina]UPM44831.1 pre-peptidase C-terminal domain-containing protein [Halocatena salina]
MVLSVGGGGAVTTGVLAEESDDGDSRETAMGMAANSTETGALDSDDVDWYAFDVEAGERIWVHLKLGSNDSIINENKSARFDIFGPSGDEVNEYPSDVMGPVYRPNAGATMQALGGTMAQQSGTYYVRVKGENITQYDLTVETQRLDQYDPNEQPASATPIESGETISAVMSGPDRDTYAIDLDKGETISVTASMNAQLLGPNASDATITGHHNEYVVTDKPPWATQLNHTANASGTYFIHTYPYEEGIGSYNMEDPYELSVSVSGDNDNESPNEDDSVTDDGPTETPDETEQTDSDESVDDGDITVDDTTDESSMNTDGTDQSDFEETIDDTDADASERSECDW